MMIMSIGNTVRGFGSSVASFAVFAVTLGALIFSLGFVANIIQAISAW